MLDVPSTPIRVKSEPVEAALGADPEEEEDVLEQMEVSSQDTGDGDEQVVSMVGGMFPRLLGHSE